MTNTKTQPPIIVWLRQDLRLQDNPALYHAAQQGPVLPVYIWDEHNPGNHILGSAARCWLYYALQSIQQALNHQILILEGDPKQLLPQLIENEKAQAVYWNRCYEPWCIDRDRIIKEQLQSQNITVQSFKASLLLEPWENVKKDGTAYRVFTPFYNQAQNLLLPNKPLPAPDECQLATPKTPCVNIEQLPLLPRINWHQTLCDSWTISESGAHERLVYFIHEAIDSYQSHRDRPDKAGVSRLSPYLNFGQISPNQIWHATKQLPQNNSINAFQRQLIWREFSYHLLYYFPGLPNSNFKTKFNQFPWRYDQQALQRWQMGMTGIPFIDAAMRELWHTGYMHNRLRMVVGSFLVKNLLQHWHHGERWFWDTLFDADLANNSVGWQWIAGTGLDAAPYFRIFNPVTQGEKFDPNGYYTYHYVPELKHLPLRYLMKPWQAPLHVLQKAGIQLDKDYPRPIVDIKQSRQRALNAFHNLPNRP